MVLRAVGLVDAGDVIGGPEGDLHQHRTSQPVAVAELTLVQYPALAAHALVRRRNESVGGALLHKRKVFSDIREAAHIEQPLDIRRVCHNKGQGSRGTGAYSGVCKSICYRYEHIGLRAISPSSASPDHSSLPMSLKLQEALRYKDALLHERSPSEPRSDVSFWYN